MWLHPLDEPEASARLCRHHADSLVAPLGWRFFDYREPAAAQRRIDELTVRRPEPEPIPEPALAGAARDDFDDLLDAHTPLLERAFRGARAS
jgi:hypothetical protein